ncbi:MAG: hypothetical protein MI810_18540 [Flavobacteriales bacterium]|nr:hypothetical protein [Flavobacteriales bacterium]
MRIAGIIGMFAVVVIAFSSCKRNNGCSWSEKAIVEDWSEGNDTCGIVFRLVESGEKVEPTNLASFSNLTYEHGDLVWLSHKKVSGASTCGLGEVVKIRCIAEREF